MAGLADKWRWCRWLLATVLTVSCGDESLAPKKGGDSSTPRPVPVAIIATTTVTPRAGGSHLSPVAVKVIDQQGRGVSGVRLYWRVLAGGGAVLPDWPETTADGSASAGWRLGLRVDELQVLEVSAPSLSPLRMYARLTVNDSVVVGTDGIVASDTIGAVLPDAVRLELRWPDGTPVIGAQVRFAAEQGSGAVANSTGLTDSLGGVGVAWQLGDQAGVQRVVATVSVARANEMLIRALTPSAAVDTAGDQLRVEFQAMATAGHPVSLRIIRDSSLVLDALGATTLAKAEIVDRAGNAADPALIHWGATSQEVISVSPVGEVRAIGDGTGYLTGQAGQVADTAAVAVIRVATNFRFSLPADTINRLGDTLDVAAVAVDRLGSEIDSIRPVWKNLTPQRGELVSDGKVVPVAAGHLWLEASGGSVVDTARMFVRQVVATLQALRTADTIILDSIRPIPVEARDSNGFFIAAPALSVTASDPTLIQADTGGRIRATYPGTTRLVVSADEARTELEVTVEGIAVRVNGIRRAETGPLDRGDRIEVSNGRLRLVWSDWAQCEKADYQADTWVDNRWFPATGRCPGDWVYVASPVSTSPTEVKLLQVDTSVVQLWMRFGDHWFEPQLVSYPESYQRQSHPFTRSVWLRPREYGYFTHIELEGPVLDYPNVEHEVGFGGLWGSGTVRTAEVDLNTDSLTGIINYNWDYNVDAAEFLRVGDPIARSLVPLPQAPMITPVFPGWGYGSVYVYNYGRISSYGAYLYAAPLALAEPTRSVCRTAWTTAPFQLPAVSESDLAGCGPP